MASSRSEENVNLKHLEMKMADFKNHRRFMLRCLCKGLTPVSIRLKSTVRTPKGIYTVRKAEKMLMNEIIRSINNMITMFNCQINTCIESLGSRIEVEAMEECQIYQLLKRKKTLQDLGETERQIQLIVAEKHRWMPKPPTWQEWVWPIRRHWQYCIWKHQNYFRNNTKAYPNKEMGT